MRKKLFAILMSAMMMVTFMPAMAFASVAGTSNSTTATVLWADDYSSCTVDGLNAPVTRTLVKDDQTNATSLSDWNGLIKASAASPVYGVTVTDVYYYDLSLAKVVGVKYAGTSGNYFDLSAKSYMISQSEFTTNFKSNYWYDEPANTQKKVKVMFAKPSYASGTYTGTYGAGVSALGMRLSGSADDSWALLITVPELDPTKTYETQSFSLPVKIERHKNATEGTAYPFVGTVSPLAFTVQAEQITDAVATYAMDGKGTYDGSAPITVQYDGAEHALTQNALTGVESTYKMQDATTGFYNAVDAVKVQNFGTYKVKATAKKGTGAGTTKDLTINVVAANAPTIAFDVNDAPKTGENANTFNVAEGFDVMKYIVVTPSTAGDDNKDAADKKATTANEALLMEYFNDFYTVVQTPKKYDEAQIKATFKAKDLSKLTTAEKDALIAKYGQLLKNFGITATRANITAPNFVVADSYANFNVTVGGDIEWVKAPLTKKYYNKSGKLAKTYTFAVEAKADSKVTYKLTNGGEMIKIDKNTGKVTVKKGLKVGTYKVYVTAKAGTSTDTYTLTIKMAKKK